MILKSRHCVHIMGINIKVLSVLVVAFLIGCSGNNGNTKTEANNDLKRFSGVVNNASVKGIDVGAIQIGKHGQFALNEDNQVNAITNTSDENGRFGFSISTTNIGPYVISVRAPEFEVGSESEQAAKMSCQLAAGCEVNGKKVAFGEYYALEANRQWSAAVEFISNGQFIVVNPITEMAKALGYTMYINDGVDADLNKTSTPAPNYYSNYGITKGNSQTAAVFGLGDILSKEPANLARLHELNINGSTSIEESIRYGALVAAWQQLELEYNNNALAGDDSFQEVLISQYLNNQGQLYQAAALDNQILSLKDWYQAALDNLKAVKGYYKNLNKTMPNEINLVIQRFETEISNLVDGTLTTAKPTIPEHYLEDYADAVMKTKAMVNYITNLQDHFATKEYRDSIGSFSDVAINETRRLSPQLDKIFEKLMSVQEYYFSCTHGACDTASIWHGNSNTYTNSTKTLIVKTPADTNLRLSQSLVFDDRNPEGSAQTNVHDLFIAGSFKIDGLYVELSNSTSEQTDSLQSSFRYSFAKKLSELPLPPEPLAGGMGVSEDEQLLPDYIEMALPNFELYDPATLGTANEFKMLGSLTALMIANTDAADALKPEEQKLGKRYNLSSVNGTLQLLGKSQGVTSSGTEIKDGALFHFEAAASEAFISTEDSAAYFPDRKYPTFDSFFKPRSGFKIGKVTDPLVVSRKGTMDFPKLDSEGNPSETETTQVQYIELDYEMGGLERYVVYPKLAGDDKYWGIICTARSGDEDKLDAAAPGYTETVQDSSGVEYQKSLLSCPLRDKYAGNANPDDFINQIYELNKNLFSLREYNGHGVYRIDYNVDVDGKLSAFPDTETAYSGTLEKPIVLGVDSLRLQLKPRLVSNSGDSYLPESILNISLVWRTHDLIDVNALLAFDAERIINNPNGSGLPYLAVGSDSESYSIAYRTNADGSETGEYAMAWTGVQFIDGPIDGTKVMQRTDVEELKEGVFAGIGSNVSYQSDTDVTDEKCGFFARGTDPTVGEKCDAIAYFTFRGLVTGSLREERDGVYVIRYIDGSFQILGQ